MHIITIACAPVALQFVFKTQESADAAWAICNVAQVLGDISIIDDFGQTGVFKANQISCKVLENCDLSRRAHVERSLHQSRMQADLQKATEADPILRMARAGGGAMLTPFGMNGRGN
jgi:hypothetical protein